MTTATSSQTNPRWQEIVNIWQKDKWLYSLIGFAAGFIFGIAAADYLGQIVAWFAGGFWDDALSTAIILIVIDRIYNFRSQQKQKQELIFQLGADDATITKPAVHLLRYRGWLEDGTLKQADLRMANLQQADLLEANFQKADMESIDLIGANLWGANLAKAYLAYAQLQDANLTNANLEGASLSYTNLKGAILVAANLQGAFLKDANIDNVIWEDTISGTAILPDGTKWTEERDMRVFTDLHHPDFTKTWKLILKIRQEMGIEPIGH